jgi:hypothetical protein
MYPYLTNMPTPEELEEMLKALDEMIEGLDETVEEEKASEYEIELEVSGITVRTDVKHLEKVLTTLAKVAEAI